MKKEFCKALGKQKDKEKQPDIRERIAGITLLSIDECKKHWKNIKPISNWWWLRSPDLINDDAARVLPLGLVDVHCHIVVNSGAYVRPALILKGSPVIGQSFTYGGKTWTVISDTLALADEPFCTMAFRKDWKAKDANAYEASDIREYLSTWLMEAMEEENK